MGPVRGSVRSTTHTWLTQYKIVRCKQLEHSIYTARISKGKVIVRYHNGGVGCKGLGPKVGVVVHGVAEEAPFGAGDAVDCDAEGAGEVGRSAVVEGEDVIGGEVGVGHPGGGGVEGSAHGGDDEVPALMFFCGRCTTDTCRISVSVYEQILLGLLLCKWNAEREILVVIFSRFDPGEERRGRGQEGGWRGQRVEFFKPLRHELMCSGSFGVFYFAPHAPRGRSRTEKEGQEGSGGSKCRCACEQRKEENGGLEWDRHVDPRLGVTRAR